LLDFLEILTRAIEGDLTREKKLNAGPQRDESDI